MFYFLISQSIWEQLYDTNSSRDIGTLYYFRQRLGKKNVYADVKKNYKSAAELMDETTKAYICEAFMEWAGLDSFHSTPTKLRTPSLKSSKESKLAFMNDKLGLFVEEYVFPELNIEKASRLQQEQKRQSQQQQQQQHSYDHHQQQEHEEQPKDNTSDLHVGQLRGPGIRIFK